MTCVKGAQLLTHRVGRELGEGSELGDARSLPGAREAVVDGQADPFRPVEAHRYRRGVLGHSCGSIADRGDESSVRLAEVGGSNARAGRMGP